MKGSLIVLAVLFCLALGVSLGILHSPAVCGLIWYIHFVIFEVDGKDAEENTAGVANVIFDSYLDGQVYRLCKGYTGYSVPIFQFA